MDYQQLIATDISVGLNGLLSEQEVVNLLEKPKFNKQGDIAFPCFTLAKKLKKAPQVIASELQPVIHNQYIEKVEAMGPYLNFFLNKLVI